MKFNKSTSKRGNKYIDDRRGRSIPGGGKAIGGAGGIIMVLLAMFLGPGVLGGDSSIGANGLEDLIGGQSNNQGTTSPYEQPCEDPRLEFSCAVLVDTNETWEKIFEENGVQYTATKLVVFDDAVATDQCGNASSHVGPFYCPGDQDQKVYIDLGFFEDLESRFGAPGDFAQAYVLAHEVGHHIQAITGQSKATREKQAVARNEAEKNLLSVQLELQADCYAGVWGYSAQQRGLLSAGDIDEGIAAAESVGDDRLQGSNSNAHNWTHGSSEQRQFWFKKGFSTGDPNVCDTSNVTVNN